MVAGPCGTLGLPAPRRTAAWASATGARPAPTPSPPSGAAGAAESTWTWRTVRAAPDAERVELRNED